MVLNSLSENSKICVIAESDLHVCFFCLLITVSIICNFLKAGQNLLGNRNLLKYAFNVMFYVNLSRSYAVFNISCKCRCQNLQFSLMSLLFSLVVFAFPYKLLFKYCQCTAILSPVINYYYMGALFTLQ